jgi:hypothetical protein
MSGDGRAARGRWRAFLHAIHRDVGFFALGLTVVYGVSGVAVNHRGDWNYNQSTEIVDTRVGTPAELLDALPEARRAELQRAPGAVTSAEEEQLVARLTTALRRRAPPRNVFWRGPDRLGLFYETGERDTVDYHPSTGVARNKVMRDRPLLRAMNFLHLNEGRRFWTYVADGFAVALVFLALSGMVMVKGRKGLLGRGGVLAVAGVVVPLLGLALLRWR